MISGLSLAANAAGYLIALSITLVSGYYTYRQRLTAYQLTRDFLILAYGIILFLMVIDFARVLTSNPSLLKVYPLFSFGLGFLEAILLLSAAVGGYLRPNGSTYNLLFQDLRKHTGHLLMFVLFIAGTVIAEAYLAIFKPDMVVVAQDFAGGTVEAVRYTTSFSLAVGGLFFFFLAYPVSLLVVGALRVQNPQMKRGQLGLAVGFAGCSAIYLIAALSLFNFTYDLTAVAYVILAGLFGIAARNFRRAAIFAGFVSAVVTVADRPAPAALKVVAKGGRQVALDEGEMSLVEVDTSVRYEETLKALVAGYLAENRGVFIISSRGSRLNAFFSEVKGVKLYTMSESQRYIAPSTTRNDEVNLPAFDPGVLLEVLDRTASSVGEPTAIVFDSISDMLIFSGFQACYKFLKAAGEIISGKKAIALFVLFAGAHEERDVTAIKSIFAAQLKVGPDGFEIVR